MQEQEVQIESKYLQSEEHITQFKQFLLENFDAANSKNLCSRCWCLCNRYQMNKHKQMGHALLTPRHFKDWKTFCQLAD